MPSSALHTVSAATNDRADDRPSLPALIVVVEGARYAFRLRDVIEVTPAAALLPPSTAGTLVLGYLDLRGEVLTVLGARDLLALPARALTPGDRFVVVQTPRDKMAIVVDQVAGVEDLDPLPGSSTDRDDGPILARRANAADGESLVTFIDLERPLARERVDLDGSGAP